MAHRPSNLTLLSSPNRTRRKTAKPLDRRKNVGPRSSRPTSFHSSSYRSPKQRPLWSHLPTRHRPWRPIRKPILPLRLQRRTSRFRSLQLHPRTQRLQLPNDQLQKIPLGIRSHRHRLWIPRTNLPQRLCHRLESRPPRPHPHPPTFSTSPPSRRSRSTHSRRLSSPFSPRIKRPPLSSRPTRAPPCTVRSRR